MHVQRLPMNQKNPPDQFCRRIGSRLAVPDGAEILVGVSGGVDSMVLLHVLRSLNFKCRVLHVDHGLRGAAAEEDAALVKAYSRKWRVPFEGVTINVAKRVAQTEESVQMAARHLRYDALLDCAKAHNIRYVAVGHNRNDQAETVILNLTRGTGPEGLAGMRLSRPMSQDVTLIRPLLEVSRDSIVAYAKDVDLSWRDDDSNQDDTFERARLRQRVMPQLQDAAIARSAALMQDWVDQLIRPTVEREFNAAAGKRSLSVTALAEMAPVLACRVIMEALRRWLPDVRVSNDLAERILSLVGQQTGRKIELGAATIWRGRRDLVFARPSNITEVYGGYLSADQAIRLPQGRLSLKITSERPASLSDLAEAWTDGDMIAQPLRVRRWRAGDRMRPLGMTGHKKVSDILTDNAVPVDQRADQFVVCSGDDIVWVAGHCISNAHRVKAETQNFARLRLELPTENLVLFKSSSEIQARVCTIGQTLASTYKDKRPLVIVLLKGAFVFAADLIRVMDIPMEVEFWGLSSYSDDLKSAGSIKEVIPLSTDVSGRHVIVIEDIVDSGRTIEWVRRKLGEKNTASVAVVTLLHSRGSSVSVDYAGFATDKYFVVGYGLDAAQKLRNLPDLYYLKQDVLTQ